MKWIEFILFLVIDLLLLIYAVSYFLGVTPPAPTFAKMIFAVMCILIISGTRITYREARGGVNERHNRSRGHPDHGR